MSYELYFWKQSTSSKRSATETLKELLAGKPVSGTKRLPIKSILKALEKALSEIEVDNKDLNAYLQTPEGSMGFFWSTKWFKVVRFGGADAELDQVVGVMRGFGCALYDPQIGRRYAIGKAPRFQRPEPSDDLPTATRKAFDEIFGQFSGDEDLKDAVKKARAIVKRAKK